MGSPIRTSRDHCSFASFSVLFAGLHVLLRLSSPRHPPDALIHLTLSFEEPFDFISIGVDDQPYLDSLIWQSLLLCCVLFLPFVFQEQLIQSSPKFLWFVYFFFQYQYLFQAAWKMNTACCIKQYSKQINIVFVCWFRLSNLLKINAFLKSQIKVNYKK